MFDDFLTYLYDEMNIRKVSSPFLKMHINGQHFSHIHRAVAKDCLNAKNAVVNGSVQVKLSFLSIPFKGLVISQIYDKPSVVLTKPKNTSNLENIEASPNISMRSSMRGMGNLSNPHIASKSHPFPLLAW